MADHPDDVRLTLLEKVDLIPGYLSVCALQRCRWHFSREHRCKRIWCPCRPCNSEEDGDEVLDAANAVRRPTSATPICEYRC